MASVRTARLLTGSEAVANAMRQIDPDVVPIYPITPQTPIIERFTRFVADGETSTEIVNVESEHSAMSAAVGSALAGARTMTATSSQGLALMVEVIYIAAGMRAPIVMAVGNRALSAPINIHGDHSDGYLARDSGAIQLFAENAQEAYDLMVMAPRIAEHPDVLLPVLVGQDGFTITHSAEPVELLPDEAVRAFVGEYRIPAPLLDLSAPRSQGMFAMPDYYFELRHQIAAAMERAREVIEEVAAEYEELSGRRLSALEEYRLEDAERALVCMGSTAGTVKDVVDELRAEGERVGLLEVRSFRPLPIERIRAACSGCSEVAVLDRADTPGGVGALHAECAAILCGSRARVRGHVYGLGGRDLSPAEIRAVFAGAAPRYVGLRSAS
ncbi:MAG: pyruvate ferredoxin oxidoreductase [Thermoleophilia bacterium]|nr:pyruvate ferredoxin oxidoreductase [Thermoleophilia bacterium]